MKLSIFGPRGCGKTTYLTCLYGQGAKMNSFAIIASDDRTRNYLRQRWNALLEGNEIQATAMQLFALNLIFSANGNKYEIELKDFAGALVMQDTTQDEIKKKLKEILYQSFQESDAIVIFIEAGDLEGSEVERKRGIFDRRQELETLLEVLAKQERKDLLSRPIAIVVTKWDKVAKIYGNTPDSGKKFMEANYQNIYGTLSQFADSIQVFTCSAYGFNVVDENGTMDLTKISPYNLETPFCWIGEKIDEVRYLAGKIIAQENPGRYDISISNWKNLIKQISAKSNWRALALQELHSLQFQYWKRQVIKFSVLVICLMALGMSGLYAYEKTNYENILLVVNPKSSEQNPHDAIIKAKTYLVGHRFFNFPIAAIEKNMQELQFATENKFYSKIKELSAGNQDEESLKLFSKECQQFLEAYPNSQYISIVSKYLQESNAKLRQYKSQKDFDLLLAEYNKISSSREENDFRNWINKAISFRIDNSTFDKKNNLETKIKEAESKYIALQSNNELRRFSLAVLNKSDAKEYVSYCKAYLENNPNTSIRSDIEKKIQEKDDEIFGYGEINARNGSSLGEKIKGYKEYLSTGFINHKKECEKKILDLEEDLYQQIKQQNNDFNNLTSSKVHRIARNVEEYLEQSYFRKHIRELNTWQDFYKKISKGISIRVTIGQVSLQKSNTFFDYVTNPDIKVIIAYNREYIATDQIDDCGWNPIFNHTGTLNWCLNDSSSLSTCIICYDYSNTERTTTVPDSSFLPKYVNGNIYHSVGTISLSSDFQWPTLP